MEFLLSLRVITRRSAGILLSSLCIAVSNLAIPSHAAVPGPESAAIASEKTEIDFHRLPLDEALIQNSVTSIIQDRRGLLWFGTLGGVNVYDGYRFRVISSNPREENSLSGVHVNALFEDSSGNIWIAGFRGWLNRIDPARETIARYSEALYGAFPGPTSFLEIHGELYVGTATGLYRYLPGTDSFEPIVGSPVEGTIFDMTPAGSDRFWIATQNGIYLYSPADGVIRHYIHVESDPGSLPSNVITRLLQDSHGRLWAATAGNGLARLDPESETFAWFRSNPNRPNSLGSDLVVDMLEDSQGRIWIGTQGGGLNLYLPDQAGFRTFLSEASDPGTISVNDVWSLFEDRSGLIWIGTAGGGLNQVNPSRSRFQTLQPRPFREDSLRNPFVWDIAESADGEIWLATLAGLERYSPTSGRYRIYEPAPGHIDQNQLQSLEMDATGRIWVGAVDGSLYRFDRETEEFQEVFREGAPPGLFDSGRIWHIQSDSRDRVWVMGASGAYAVNIHSNDVVDLLPASDAIPMRGDPVRVMLELEDGSFWLGGGGAGLIRFKPGEGVLDIFRHEPERMNSLSHNVVRSLYLDESGDLWIGTLNGLNRWSRRDREAGRDSFTLYTMAEGLPNNTVYGILPGMPGILWLTTNSGISRFDIDSGHFENFGVADGLPSNEMNGGAELKASDGRLYFGGVAGVTIVEPGEELWRNQVVPDVAVTGITVGGKRVPLGKLADGAGLNLPYDRSDITVEFAAMDFFQPEKNQFRYRLLGAFDDWREADSRRISLSGLAAGEYVLEVIGSNNDGVWSDTAARLKFSVAAPPWRTPMAYLAYALVLLFSARAYHLAQQRRLRREREFNEELGRAHSLAEANHQLALRNARSDMLTQLPNRSSLLKALARYMRFSRSKRQELVVTIINLDRFKRVNDSFGHKVGDRILKETARRLEELVESNDFLARSGGDDFVWLQTVPEGTVHGDWVKGLADRINAAVQKPFEFQNPPVVITATMGVAVYHRGSESATDLLGYADIALHIAKTELENQVRLYEPAMSRTAREQISIEARIKQALANDEFVAYYQPLMSIDGETLKGLEALIRWFPPDSDPVYPDQFIPVAEQSGLIVDIGNWMIHHVCNQLRQWQANQPIDFQVAINVSMRQLRSGTLVPTLRSALEATGILPSALKIEITESAMMENVEDTAEQLQEVRKLGVEISVDDFGTGFSSLSHLKLLPVNELKIDRSFVMDVVSSAESRTIVMSIVRLAHELSLRVVAEGVEDAGSLEFLAGAGCDIAQGYYFSKPVPASALQAAGWLDRTSRARQELSA